jgi:DNA-binding CsgD family transcriptional regulator
VVEAGKRGNLTEFLRIFQENGIFCLGVCSTNAWISWVNNADSFNSLSTRLVDQGSMLAVLVIAVFVCWRWDSGKTGFERFDWPISILMAASTFFISSTPFHLPYTLGAIALGEVGMAWCWLRWGEYLSKMNLRGVIACVFSSYVLSCLIRIVLSFLPDIAAVVLVSMLPLASIFMLRKSSKIQLNLVAETPRAVSATRKSFNVLILVSICFFVLRFMNMLAYNIFSSPTLPSLSSFSNVAELCLSLLILYYIFIHKGVPEFVQIWPIPVFLLATALFVFPLENYGTYSTYLLDIVGSILVMFMWLVLADISHHSFRHAYVVFAIGRIAYTLPTLILAPVFYYIDPVPYVSVLLACSNYVLLIFTALFFGKRNTILSQIFSDLDRKPQIEAFDQIKERCLELGRVYALTNREIEIISYSCQGRSRSYIAETLFISANTVKSHTQRAYAKLGVHSKSELQKLLGL